MLEPARVATLALSKSSIDVLAAEAILNFLLKEVSESNSELSQRFHEHLVELINARRDPKFVSLVLYLNDRKALSEYSPLDTVSKTAAAELGIQIGNRLFGPSETTDSDSQVDQTAAQGHQQSQVPSSSSSMHDRMMMAVKSGKSSATPLTSDCDFKKDFQRYERTGLKSAQLENLQCAVSAVPPTSTESESGWCHCYKNSYMPGR